MAETNNLHLTLVQRFKIEARLSIGHSYQAIAVVLGVGTTRPRDLERGTRSILTIFTHTFSTVRVPPFTQGRRQSPSDSQSCRHRPTTGESEYPQDFWPLGKQYHHRPGHHGVVVTLVERNTPGVACHTARRRTKTPVANANVVMMRPIPDNLKTITFDNDGECADHAKIARALACKVYFAKPYH